MATHPEVLTSAELIRHVHPNDLSVGVLGFRWGESREQVYAKLPEPAKREVQALGSRFFTHITAVLKFKPVHLHFQFGRGLAGLTMSPMHRVAPPAELMSRFTEVAGQEELVMLLGTPSDIHDDNPGVLRVITWDLPPVVVVLSEAGIGHLSLTYRLAVSNELGRPELRGREIELEDIVPSGARIQYHIDRDEVAEGATLNSGRTLGLGWCPHCGCPIGTWHRPECPFGPKARSCMACGQRPAELPSDLCLGCAQVAYVREQLALTSPSQLKDEHELDTAIRIDKALEESAPELRQAIREVEQKNRRTDEWFRNHHYRLLFGTIAVLALLRLSCNG